MENKDFKLTAPVLFLTFNRMDTAKQVFEEIKKAEPQSLFLASDGPRENKEGEKEKVEQIRKYLLDNITWKCNVKTLFREKNLGCKMAVSSAITWFFENVEQGIILEDDCLPSQSFFRFCQELLEKYKDDDRIMQISGTNVESETKIDESYFFSTRLSPWGWATWRRAWNLYDREMNNYDNMLKKNQIKMLRYPLFKGIIGKRGYKMLREGTLNTWDYQWYVSCILNNGLGIIPRVNLVKNLGFFEGTHTTNYDEKKVLPLMTMNFPLNHNKIVIDNLVYYKNFARFFKKGRIKRRALGLIYLIFRKK